MIGQKVEQYRISKSLSCSRIFLFQDLHFWVLGGWWSWSLAFWVVVLHCSLNVMWCIDCGFRPSGDGLGLGHLCLQPFWWLSFLQTFGQLSWSAAFGCCVLQPLCGSIGLVHSGGGFGHGCLGGGLGLQPLGGGLGLQLLGVGLGL